jgi:hypothetical protein
MDDPKQQRTQGETKPKESPSKNANSPDRDKSDSPAGELLEGDGSPGLTITGGGGHA